MSWMDGGWSSHIEALAWAGSLIPKGAPIVEMGGGWYSTPVLHGIAAARGSEMWTIDDPVNWMDEYERIRAAYETPWHHFDIGTYKMPVEDLKGGLVFADQTAWYRAPSVMEAKARNAGIIVIHDTEPSPWNMEHIDDLPDGSRPEFPPLPPGEVDNLKPYPGMYATLSSFKYRVDFTVFPQHATAVSDTVKLVHPMEKKWKA